MTARDRFFEILAAVLLPSALFLLFFHPAILDPHHVGWLLRGTDNGQNALGLQAWLRDPAAGWSLRTTRLNAPDGVPLLFTDSNPLLAILSVPIAARMAPGVQFVGPWYLACLFLQTVFARALLAPLAPDRATRWLGVALLLLLPTLYARYVHANLFAHWLLLWALWIFADERRAGDARWWIAVLGVAALVHNYLLFLVAAIWASAMLERIVNAPQRIRVIVGALATIGATIVVVSRLGIARDFTPTYTYGGFAMPLDALWNPSNPSYSMLLPAVPQRLHRAFEGFQYLGIGTLSLLVMTPAMLWRNAPVTPAIAALHRRLLWLGPAGVLLTLLAVSQQVDWAGRTVFEIPLARPLLAALDPVRASGRLFWPVAYTLVLLAVTAAYRLARHRATLLLGGAVLLQVADMTGMMQAIRQVTAEAPANRTYRLTRDPRWDHAIAAARDVTFAPTDPMIAPDLYQEVAWRAVIAGRPVRLVHAARDTQATRARLDAEHHDFDAGRLAPGRLYILFPQARVPRGAASRLVVLDGVRVLLPISSPRSAS